MKINELVNEINECSSFTAEKDDDEKCIYIGTDSYDNLATIKYDVHYLDDVYMVFFPLEVSNDCRKLGNFYALLNLINKFVNTPVDKRFSEKKYRVRLKGFNADSGKQYLTCSDKRGSIKGQSFFGCHLQKGLCQEFTTKELDTLLELAKDRNQQWLAMLLSDPDNRELVEENND